MRIFSALCRQSDPRCFEPGSLLSYVILWGMEGELLHTKLYRPLLRPSLVPRPHLIARIEQGVTQTCKLTLISAPAGFGKSTLLAEWTATDRGDAHAARFCWLSLDQDDDDLSRFLTYVVTALQRAKAIDAASQEQLLTMLLAPQLPPVNTVLTALINALAGLSTQLILVLDDYHSINAQAIDSALTFLLDHQPRQLHLVIATRDDPQLPLARLRARGQLNELRAADLRFSTAEATQFLNRAMGLALTTEEIAALEERTEGWIAGLQLAALALQAALAKPDADAGSRIQAFSGSHRFVMDYLLEEVLAQQPADVKRFLLQTAVLNRFTGALCNEVTEQNHGQETLEALAQANLFIVPLDEERRWYRYHHLFADLLRRRLYQEHPDWIPGLHRRASQWYEHSGFIGEAIAHALNAGDSERAARLMNGHVDTLWQRGEHARLSNWLAALPPAVLHARPRLCIFRAWYLFASGKQEAAGQVLQSASQALEADNGQLTDADKMQLCGRTAVIRAFMAAYQGDVPAIIQHARQALDTLPEQDLTWRSSAAITLGDAYGFQGDISAAYQARLAAALACEAAGDIYFLMIANLKLAITLRAQGRLHETIAMCRQQIHLAEEKGMHQAPAVGWALAVWGEVLAELNDLDGALQRAQTGVELVESGLDLAMLGWSYLCLVRVLFSRGETAAAADILQKMVQIDREADVPPWISNHTAAWQARLWLKQNQLAAASNWATARGVACAEGDTPPSDIDYFALIEYTVLARIWLAEKRLTEAHRLLEHLLAVATAGQHTSKVIEILMLQALAHHAADDTTRGVATLAEAFRLAEPEGYVRIFVDEGEPCAHLLAAARQRGVARAYVERLLSAFPATNLQPTAPPDSYVEPVALVEPLSERECEVLARIAQGLTNQEIADRLYLSLNTVKVHTRNIYGKLGVHSRTQAVATAKALGIQLP